MSAISASFHSSEELYNKLKALPDSTAPTARPLSPFTDSPASPASAASTPSDDPATPASPASPATPITPVGVTPPQALAALKVSTRDPHQPPDFTKISLAAPTSPILYLPPLLSSLPPSYDTSGAPPSLYGPPLKTTSHLPSIDEASLALHRALHRFHPLDSDYALKPYGEGFNWADLELPEELESEWYCVAFRSIRKKDSDSGPLYAADQKAHEEAVQNGGLLMYWYGTPRLDTGLNLATCVWQSRAHAIAANSRPHHVRAMRLAAASYEMYDLERYTLRKVAGERGLRIEEWGGAEVGRR